MEGNREYRYASYVIGKYLKFILYIFICGVNIINLECESTLTLNCGNLSDVYAIKLMFKFKYFWKGAVTVVKQNNIQLSNNILYHND